jgi:hypothetical protein
MILLKAYLAMPRRVIALTAKLGDSVAGTFFALQSISSG